MAKQSRGDHKRPSAQRQAAKARGGIIRAMNLPVVRKMYSAGTVQHNENSNNHHQSKGNSSMRTAKTQLEKGIKSKGNGKPVQIKNSKTAKLNIFAQRVEKKAYELYENGGRLDGCDWANWFEAEKTVEAEMTADR